MPCLMSHHNAAASVYAKMGLPRLAVHGMRRHGVKCNTLSKCWRASLTCACQGAMCLSSGLCLQACMPTLGKQNCCAMPFVRGLHPRRRWLHPLGFSARRMPKSFATL
eukprot:1347228-Amphidinium_carterae.1